MKKVLAFFGAFNPPTKAHVELSKLAMEQTGNEGVVFVPSKASYILDEQKKSFVFSDEDRLMMLYQLSHTYHWIRTNNYDIYAKEQPRTYESLKHLRDFCHFEPTLLVGADQFCDMARNWKHVPEIAEEFGIVCLTRSIHNAEYVLANHPFYQKIAAHVQIVKAPDEYRNISSSRVRAYMKVIEEGYADLKEALPEEIYDYIKENCL